MNRLNALHLTDRVELIGAVDGHETARVGSGRFRLRPTAYHYVGLLGFVCCSALVIATASFVALQIQ